MQRIGRLVKDLARLQCPCWPLVDLYLVYAFDDVANCVAPGMSMRRAAIARIALGQANGQPTTKHGIHDLIEQFRGSLAWRLRERRHNAHIAGTEEIGCKCSSTADGSVRRDRAEPHG